MAFRVDGVIAERSRGDLHILDAPAFVERCASLVRELSAATSVGEAQSIYDALLPVEAERVRRDAAERLRAGERPVDALFVLVGAQPDAPTLAVVASPARYLVLLHTDEEARHARAVSDGLELSATEATLRSIGDGKSAVRVYETIWREWEALGRPAEVGVDVTGGLKIMSAAAAAAAFAIPGARVYYIDSRQIRIERRVFNCEERRIQLRNPYEVFGEIRRGVARRLMLDGRFEAAAQAYDALAQTVRESKADELRALLCEAYASLSALDFEQGAAKLAGLVERLDVLAPLMPNDEVVMASARLRGQWSAAVGLAEFAERLGRAGGTDPSRDVDALGDPVCRELVALLLETAERRQADHEYDVAALLAYRASELIVQRRLAVLAGVDTAKFDWDALANASGQDSAELIAAYNRLVEPRFRLDPAAPPRMMARSESFAALAAAFPNDLVQVVTVRRYGQLGDSRNRSLLAHGLQKMNGPSTRALIDLARQMFAYTLSAEGIAAEERAALEERHRFFTPSR